MNDLISRKAAIEVLEWFDQIDPLGYTPVQIVRALPTAELITCKDCKFTDGDGLIADGRYWCILHESFMYYCSDAERRTDDCKDNV